MKEQQKFEIKVGLTVLSGLLILLVGFYLFKNWSIGGAGGALEMRFPVSAGLQEGDIVTVNGVTAGRVEAVTLASDGVRVRARMDPGVAVAADARPVIQLLELMGGKKVEITQAPGGRPAGPGDVLQGHVDPDIAGALGMLGGMEGEMRGIVRDAGTLLHGASALAADTNFIGALRETAQNLRAVSEDTRRLVAANGDDAALLLRRMGVLAQRVDTLLVELRPDARAALGDSRRVMARADSLLTDLQAFTTELRAGRGLLYTAVHDTTLAPRLDRTLRRLDTLTAILIRGDLHIRTSLW